MRRLGVQIIEESLLIIVALLAIAITVGAADLIYQKLNEIIQGIFDALNWWKDTLFPFMGE
ncbi:TPA: hypothetical protein EYP83_04225 [Candidatus Geothermarchaeota archaeon]|nr:hypothetical protein [Candidatus Geothermarchaeota archaeon]HIQ13906.1 hypothetical protein [Thermoprotei archaeon]